MTYQFSPIAGTPALADDRRAIERDEVHYRARAFGPDNQPVTLLIVNISPHGLMARCEKPFAEGDRLRVVLPAVVRQGGCPRYGLELVRHTPMPREPSATCWKQRLGAGRKRRGNSHG